MRTVFIFLLIYAMSNSVDANSSDFSIERTGFDIENELSVIGIDIKELELGIGLKQENERLMAIVLAITLGPFGGHRLYLGTRPHVPVVYTLTLGGGFGILPLIDIFHLIFTKDLTPYRYNGNVFIWRPDTSTLQ